jgi:hypothetical protein
MVLLNKDGAKLRSVGVTMKKIWAHKSVKFFSCMELAVYTK